MTYQRILESEMRTAVKNWIKADAAWQDMKTGGGDKVEKQKAFRREAVARGVVRGTARALLYLYRPYERDPAAASPGAVEKLEQEFGMPGPRQGMRALSNPEIDWK